MASFFDIFGWKFKKPLVDQDIKAGYVAPQNETAAFVVGEGYYGSYAYQLNFDQNITDDFALIHKYRQIALHPEVDRAICEIVNEAIDGTTEDEPATLNLDDLKQPESIKKKITEEFEKILQLLDFDAESYEIFRKWYVDGRMYYHIIIDPKKTDEGIQELRYISPLHIKKIREEKTELQNGIPVVIKYDDFFLYSRDLKNTVTPGTGGIKLTTDSVAYCNSGIIDETRNLVYSYLQKSLRATNQLRMEEDAIVIYRLARAPERRVFYVDVGNLPKGKAEEYLKNIQARYKNKMIYDGGTGEVKDAVNNLSMLEDYWMPRREGGKGTEITTLPGGQNLGEIQDIDYFRRKVFESLGVPLGRLMSDQSGGFPGAQLSLITREEVQFGAFIQRLRKRFGTFFKDLLKTQLILKKIITPDEWEELSKDIDVCFAENTYFAELKENEILRERITTLQLIDPQPIIGKYISVKWAKKNIMKQDDEEIEQMQKEMDEEADAEADLLKQQMEDGMPPQDPNALLPQAPMGPEAAPPFAASNFQAPGQPKPPKPAGPKKPLVKPRIQ